MDKPKTNREALDLVFTITKTQTELAKRLGLAKQYIARWSEIPLHFAIQIAEITKLPVDWMVPEQYDEVMAILGHPFDLASLIRVLSRQPNEKRRKKVIRKRRRATAAEK